MIEALMLVRAAIAARRWGCRRIVWPVQVGPDDAAVAGAVDRATAVCDLADVSPPPAMAGPGSGLGPHRSFDTLIPAFQQVIKCKRRPLFFRGGC